MEPLFFELRASLITFRNFVRWQRMIARNVCQLFSSNRGILHLNEACSIDDVSRGSLSGYENQQLCLCCVFTGWRRRWPWHPSGRYNASTRPMAAYSGFAWSHWYAPSGDVPCIVSSRRHCHRNRHWIRYIVYNRVANKSINSLRVNGFASTTPLPDPFGRVYPHPIGRIHI